MLSSPCMGLHFKVLLLAFCDDVSLACLHFHYFISRKFTEIDFFSEFSSSSSTTPPHTDRTSIVGCRVKNFKRMKCECCCSQHSERGKDNREGKFPLFYQSCCISFTFLKLPMACLPFRCYLYILQSHCVYAWGK